MSTMETPAKCVEYVQRKHEALNQQENVIDFVLVSLLLTVKMFHTLFWYFHCLL